MNVPKQKSFMHFQLNAEVTAAKFWVALEMNIFFFQNGSSHQQLKYGLIRILGRFNVFFFLKLIGIFRCCYGILVIAIAKPLSFVAILTKVYPRHRSLKFV